MKELAAAWFALLFAALSLPALAADMVPLPAGQEPVPFPTTEWSEFDAADPLRQKLDTIVARSFDGERPVSLARTRALLVVKHGRIAAERYSDGITRDTRLQSWSMSKSFLHAALGLLVGDGKLDPDAPAPVPEWKDASDPRHTITVRQLAQMVDGLAFRENYSDTDAEAMQMLFGAGRGDVGKSAAATPLGAAPGAVWSYSSGSANILARIVRDALGGREATRAYLDDRLFKPTGMTSAVPEFDASGSWIASSYVHATARDFARFGLLYLRRGFWDGRQLLSVPWAESAIDGAPAAEGRYGMLFWLNAKDKTGKCAISEKLPCDMYFARGFGGQLIAIAPSQDAVVVMLNAAYTDEAQPIVDLMADIVDALR